MKFYERISHLAVRSALILAALVTLVAGSSLTLADSASAAAPAPGEQPVSSQIATTDDITPVMLAQAREDLEASGAPKTTSDDGAETFTLSNGLTLTFASGWESLSAPRLASGLWRVP